MVNWPANGEQIAYGGTKNDHRHLPVSINIKDTKEYEPKKAAGCFTI